MPITVPSRMNTHNHAGEFLYIFHSCGEEGNPVSVDIFAQFHLSNLRWATPPKAATTKTIASEKQKTATAAAVFIIFMVFGGDVMKVSMGI